MPVLYIGFTNVLKRVLVPKPLNIVEPSPGPQCGVIFTLQLLHCSHRDHKPIVYVSFEGSLICLVLNGLGIGWDGGLRTREGLVSQTMPAVASPSIANNSSPPIPLTRGGILQPGCVLLLWGNSAKSGKRGTQPIEFM